MQFVPYAEADTGPRSRVERQPDLLIDLRTQHHWVNEESAKFTSPNGCWPGSDGGSASGARLRGRVIRYVDWLIPGVLSMNMMWSALYGVGLRGIVRYRKNGVLKRLRRRRRGAVDSSPRRSARG